MVNSCFKEVFLIRKYICSMFFLQGYMFTGMARDSVIDINTRPISIRYTDPDRIGGSRLIKTAGVLSKVDRYPKIPKEL